MWKRQRKALSPTQQQAPAKAKPTATPDNALILNPSSFSIQRLCFSISTATPAKHTSESPSIIHRLSGLRKFCIPNGTGSPLHANGLAWYHKPIFKVNGQRGQWKLLASPQTTNPALNRR
jgi:hypothetical protein